MCQDKNMCFMFPSLHPDGAAVLKVFPVRLRWQERQNTGLCSSEKLRAWYSPARHYCVGAIVGHSAGCGMQLLLGEFLNGNGNTFSWEWKQVAPVFGGADKKLHHAAQGCQQLYFLAYLVWKHRLNLYSHGVSIYLCRAVSLLKDSIFYFSEAAFLKFC